MQRATLAGLRAMDDQGVLGRQRDEPPLPRGKTRGIEHPITDISDVVLTPILAAAILGEDHMLKHRAQLLAGDPQQDPGPRQAFFDVEVVAVQRDTPMAVGRPWEYCLGKVAGVFI